MQINIMTTKINEKITKIRIASKLSQKELAKLLNATQSTVSVWESSLRLPPYEVIEKLSEMGREYGIEFTLDDIYRHMRKRKRNYIMNKK